jgi:dTDP-4-dehydrorhamnose 3,5-epimerase
VKVQRASIADVLVIEPEVFGDARGYLYESYNRRTLARTTGLDVDFVQDNHSRSVRNVLRGLHYQVRQPQGKLVRVTAGEIWDVVVDLRRSSSSFGRWAGMKLDAASARMLWVPPGFAHGFLVLSEHAEVQYKATDYYAPEHERTLLWNDPALAIAWPLAATPAAQPTISDKDKRGTPLAAAETYA